MADKPRNPKFEDERYVTWAQAQVAISICWILLVIGCSIVSFIVDCQFFGIRYAIRSELVGLKSPFEIIMLLSLAWSIRNLVSVAKSSETQTGRVTKTAKPYEQEAYLSFVLAIQEDRSLEDRPKVFRYMGEISSQRRKSGQARRDKRHN